MKEQIGATRAKIVLQGVIAKQHDKVKQQGQKTRCNNNVK
jgi:hypothetical protein